MGWPPQAFWQSTPYEFLAALDGYLEKTGHRNTNALGKDRLLELMAAYPDQLNEGE
ncbi:MAG: phage tail assembly chaperone [Proteobacteria bacterium]|nr:phage tail assembly chaperone [Pseudomonadota bacterium]